LLEELELGCTVKLVNIRQGEQKTSEFLKLNPNGKVPVIVDHDGPEHQPIVIVELSFVTLVRVN
jgi:GSH-dependent disulfide-bond oxidoreductase